MIVKATDNVMHVANKINTLKMTCVWIVVLKENINCPESVLIIKKKMDTILT